MRGAGHRVDRVREGVSGLLVPGGEEGLNDGVVIADAGDLQALLLDPLADELVRVHLNGAGVAPGVEEVRDLGAGGIYALADGVDDAGAVALVDGGDGLHASLSNDDHVEAPVAKDDGRDADAASAGVVGGDADARLEDVSGGEIDDLVGHPKRGRLDTRSVVDHLDVRVPEGRADEVEDDIGVHRRVRGGDRRERLDAGSARVAQAEGDEASGQLLELGVDVDAAQVALAALGEVAGPHAEPGDGRELVEGTDLERDLGAVDEQGALLGHRDVVEGDGVVVAVFDGDRFGDQPRGVAEDWEVLHLLALRSEILVAERVDAGTRRVERRGEREPCFGEPAFLELDASDGDRRDELGRDEHASGRGGGRRVVVWIVVVSVVGGDGRHDGEAGEVGGGVPALTGFPEATQGVVPVELGVFEVLRLSVEGEGKCRHGADGPWNG